MSPPAPPETLLAGVGPGDDPEEGRVTVELIERLARPGRWKGLPEGDYHQDVVVAVRPR